MRKLVSCLLAVTLLLTTMGAYASNLEPVEKSNALLEFLKQTDTNVHDIALQVQAGEKTSDLVIRAEGDSLHLVARDNGTETGHMQLTPDAVYVTSDGAVSKLQYATVTSFLQDLVKDVDAMVNEAAPSDAEVQAMNESSAQFAILASMAATQARADAVTLVSAGAAFASKFRPEYILDQKADGSSVEISLRSEAFATALAEAMDGLMMNSAMAELVDRQAAVTGGATFADMQKSWLTNREATLEAVRTMQSTDQFDEDGHWKSHFQIGEETEGSEGNQVLVCDMDTWINDDATAEMVFTLGFKDQEPLEVFEMAVSPDYFWEKLTAQKATAEYSLDFVDGVVSDGIVTVNVDGEEEIKAEFGQDYLYMKGPKGGISTSVRETWTGKIRYEMVAETAEGESSLIVDFYEDWDSLVCELKSSKSDESLMLKLSRIDKIDIEDLSESDNIKEITADMIKAEIEDILKTVLTVEAASPAA